jgi:hypothetical protein
MEVLEFERAAELFGIAEEMERKAANARGPFAKPDQSFLHRVRVGICLWDAGRFDAARPILEDVTTFDFKAARLWSDRHDTEKAFARLLMELAANGDTSKFLTMWNRATNRGEQIDWPFPSIIPYQKQLILATMSLGLKEPCKQILRRLNSSYVSKDPELCLTRSQAEKFCSSA